MLTKVHNMKQFCEMILLLPVQHAISWAASCPSFFLSFTTFPPRVSIHYDFLKFKIRYTNFVKMYVIVERWPDNSRLFG